MAIRRYCCLDWGKALAECTVRFFMLLTLALGMSGPLSAQTIAGQQASPGAAALGRCVIGMTTGNDRLLISRWIGMGLASAPQLEGLVTVDVEARDMLDRELAALFVRLFTQDCVEETRPLVRAGDQASVQVAFGMLGEIAVGELIRDPRAAAIMSNYVRYIPADTFDVFLPKR
jgi:hypothetical protein